MREAAQLEARDVDKRLEKAHYQNPDIEVEKRIKEVLTEFTADVDYWQACDLPDEAKKSMRIEELNKATLRITWIMESEKK